jgi:tetratricopeptide (TPR) repeat protein
MEGKRGFTLVRLAHVKLHIIMFCVSFFASPLLFLLLWQGPTESCRKAVEAHAGGDLDRAADELERCVDEHPADIGWLLRLCSVYQSLGRDDDLYRVSLTGIDRFPDERRFRLTAGIRAARVGELDKAGEIFSDALSRWPGDVAFRENLVQVLLLRGMANLDTGENEAAEADLRWASGLDGTNCDVLINLGRALYNLLRPEEALEVFDRVREIRPDHPSVELHRGIVLVTVGRHAEAADALDGFLARQPDPDGHYFRGMARKGIGDCHSALQDFEAAMATGVRVSADALFERAGCLERLGRIPEAEAAYRHAVELEPDRPKVRLALGQLLVRSGRREEGLSILNEAKSLYTGMVREDQAGISFKSMRPEDGAGSGP